MEKISNTLDHMYTTVVVKKGNNKIQGLYPLCSQHWKKKNYILLEHIGNMFQVFILKTLLITKKIL